MQNAERCRSNCPPPSSAYDLPLEDTSVDRALLITVLPEIPDLAPTLAELQQVLTPSGILPITEEFYDPDYPLPGETIHLAEAALFDTRERYGNLWVYPANFAKLPG